MDRRLTPSNGRVALASLKGQVKAERFVFPEPHRIGAVVCDLLSAPNGSRERQLQRGATFNVLEVHEDMAFGYAAADGYVGWLDPVFLISPPDAVTHRVAVQLTYGKTRTGLKEMGRTTSLPFGSQLTVLETKDNWSKVVWSRGTIPRDLYVPQQHLQPVGSLETDPAEVAERLIGTPYLWGGNSSFGIDCSGLVQAALLACGIPCPGDSDLQESSFPDATGAYQRGDLLFWRGHVAMVVDPDTLVHANAFHMTVAYEPITDVLARISAQGDGPLTSHKRPATGGSR